MSNSNNYDFWLLDNSLTRVTKLLSPYPLDATGTIMNFSNELDDFGQAKFRVSAYDTILTTYGDILAPHQNWLQIVKNGVIVWQGAIIENTKRTKDFIECIAAEPLWYLNKVLVDRSSLDPATGTADNIYRIFDSGTMAAAVTAILNETIATFQANDQGHPLSSMTLGIVTNPNFPPNVTNANAPPTALTGPWTFGNGITGPDLQFDFHTILYILKSFGAYSYSDFYIDENLVFNFIPFKGRDLTTVVDFTWGATGGTPSNLTDYNIPRFGQRMINHLYGIATDINGNVLHYDQTDNTSITTYGYIEGVAAYSDVKDQATLNARIQAELPLISTPDDTALTVTQSEKGNQLGVYSVGDIVAINVHNKSVDFQDSRRIVGISVQVNGTGREYINIQTNKVLPFQFAQAAGQDATAATT
jgi:hypothetical protein